MATDGTLELVSLAVQALKRIYREGYGYKKAGVSLSELTPKHGAQSDPFDPVDRERRARLMAALDAANRQFGRDRVVVASRELDPPQMNRQHLSRGYTTDWDEILTVRA